MGFPCDDRAHQRHDDPLGEVCGGPLVFPLFVPVQTSPAPSCSEFPSSPRRLPQNLQLDSLACGICDDIVLIKPSFLLRPLTLVYLPERRCISIYPPYTCRQQIDYRRRGLRFQLIQPVFFGTPSSRLHPRFLLQFPSAVRRAIVRACAVSPVQLSTALGPQEQVDCLIPRSPLNF